MPAQKKRRQKLVADPKLQGALLAHTIIYWFYCLFSITLIAVCWIIFTHQPETSFDLFGQLWLNCGPALLGSFLLLPLVLLDCLRLSLRFAGPMVRFQRAMRELVEQGETDPVELRDGDYWMEFAAHFNIVAERLKSQAATESTPSEDDILNDAKALVESFAPADSPASSDTKASKPLDSLPDAMPLDNGATAESIYSDLSI